MLVESRRQNSWTNLYKKYNVNFLEDNSKHVNKSSGHSALILG